MIRPLILLFCSSFLVHAIESDFLRAYNDQHAAKKEAPKQILEDHSQGAERVAREQDELSADVQELIQLETNDKVIKFLAEAEELMAGATDKLETKDTSGPTIAIETEIIEKIAGAAKQKQQSSSSQENQKQSALMQMLQQMMEAGAGKEGNDGQEGDKEGQDAAKKGGQGPEGDSDSSNSIQQGNASGNTEQRRLPKKSGSAGTQLPKEFQKALDAYNKGLDTKR